MSHFTDPALFELVWSAATATLLLASGVLAMFMLPWTDAEIEEVDNAFRRLIAPATPRVHSRH